MKRHHLLSRPAVLACFAATAALMLSACQSPAEQGSPADPSASVTVAPGSQTPATTAPTSGAASTGTPSATKSTEDTAPSTGGTATGGGSASGGKGSPNAQLKPQAKAKVPAKGDAAKDAPAGWPAEYRVAKKAEGTGVDALLKAQKKATQLPSSVAKEAAQATDAARPTPPDFGPAVEGAALSELQADYVEAAQNGWVTTGTTALKGEPRVVDLGQNKVRVFACIDFSGIEMKDISGKVMQPAVAAGTRASLQIYDMTLKQGAYVVTSHQVAAEYPNC